MEHSLQITLLKELMSKLDSGTNVDAGGFRKNPTTAYTDHDLAEREWNELFRGLPQMVGLSGDLPEPGSFVTMDDLGTPIILSRDADGVFHAMFNACRHRGTSVESRERGTTRRFTCPFHSWSYSSDGALVGLPKQDHFGELDKECRALVQLPAVEHNGMLWLSIDPNASIDVRSLLGEELDDEIAAWQLGELQLLTVDAYDVPLNWKLAMDTFGETYHFPSLHKNTLAESFHGNVQCYDTFGRNHRMILCRRDIDSMRERPEDDWSITIGGLPVYFLFPNVQLLPNHYGLQLVRAYPEAGDPARHTSQITFYLRPGVPRNDEARLIAERFASVIEQEDYVAAASSQVAASSGALDHFIFGRNEPALHHYHNTFREALGIDPLPLLDRVD